MWASWGGEMVHFEHAYINHIFDGRCYLSLINVRSFLWEFWTWK